MNSFPAQADLLVVNAWLLTLDDSFTAFSDGAIAICDGRIAAVGPREAAAHTQATRIIDAEGGLLLPGLINAHCHVAMTMFRGLADDVPLDGFLQSVWAAEAAHASPGNVRAAAVLGMAEMVLGGVTHVVDMYWHPAATIEAARKIGLGLSSGPVFIGFDGLDQLPWARRLAWAESFIESQRGQEGVELMLMPHSVYTLNAEQLRDVAALAQRHGLRINTHAAEAPTEMQQVQQAYGLTPVQVLQREGLLAGGALLAHAVHLTDEDIAALASSVSAVTHCPASNAKLGSGIARLGALRQAGVTVSLGTDGPASANDLDMWKAMRQAAYLQFVSTGQCDVLPARDIVAMATRGGAAATGLSQRKGVLAPGMDADFIVVGTQRPHMVPLHDPYSALVYSAGREDVEHVFVRGRQLVHGGRLTVPIADEIRQVRDVARQIQQQKESR